MVAASNVPGIDANQSGLVGEGPLESHAQGGYGGEAHVGADGKAFGQSINLNTSFGLGAAQSKNPLYFDLHVNG